MNPELILIVIFLVLVVIFPLIGRISGWSTLATFYRFSESFIGECWRFQSAEMRWKMGYNNCLTIGANESGLYISMFFLFFVPWLKISVIYGISISESTDDTISGQRAIRPATC